MDTYEHIKTPAEKLSERNRLRFWQGRAMLYWVVIFFATLALSIIHTALF
jgi:hypothetical protein